MNEPMTVAELSQRVEEFARERDWEQFHDAKNLAMALASEAGELLAPLRWVATPDVSSALEDPAVRARLVEEVADVGILALLLCARLGVTLDQAIVQKLGVNADRYPVSHAKGKSERPGPVR